MVNLDLVMIFFNMVHFAHTFSAVFCIWQIFNLIEKYQKSVTQQSEHLHNLKHLVELLAGIISYDSMQLLTATADFENCT